MCALWLKILLQTDFPGDGNLTISATEELSSHLPFVIFAALRENLFFFNQKTSARNTHVFRYLEFGWILIKQ